MQTTPWGALHLFIACAVGMALAQPAHAQGEPPAPEGRAAVPEPGAAQDTDAAGDVEDDEDEDIFGLGGEVLRFDLGGMPNASGSTDGDFRVSPGLAWLIGLGANVEIIDPVFLALRFSYRLRYYEVRGGEDLDQGLAHGTQDLIPFIGFAYRVDQSAFE